MALNTMYSAMPNSPQTTLAADITASATSFSVANGNALPAAPNLCTIGDDESAEVVKYTTKNGNTLSGVIRGQSGTTASVWTTGTFVAREFTSLDHDTFIDNINALNGDKQDSLTFDDTPTQNSANPVTSGGIYTALVEKAPINSPNLAGTPRATTASVGTKSNRIATTEFVWTHDGFYIYEDISEGSTATFSDARIDSDNWYVSEIIYGTPENVLTETTWTTDPAAHTITLGATFAGATTVLIILQHLQD